MPEMTLVGFMAHIAAVAEAEKRHHHHALERAARLIEHSAKEAIGEYQEAVGQFAAWARLADSTLAEKERLGYAPPANPLLRTGELRDSIGHAVGENEAVIGSNSDIAIYQELGTARMPPRSFLGTAGFRHGDDVANLLGAATLEAFLHGKRGLIR